MGLMNMAIVLGIMLGLMLLIVVFYTINKRMKAKKLYLVFKYVISPSYMIFYRATDKFIDGGKLSYRDKLRVEDLKTTELDYSCLHNQVKAKKAGFYRGSKVRKCLDNLQTECWDRMNDRHDYVYDSENWKRVVNGILDPLHNLYISKTQAH